MFIEFYCRCGHDFRTNSQNAGMQIICPNCLTQVIVPASTVDQSPSAVPPDSDSDSDSMLDEMWPIEGKPALATLRDSSVDLPPRNVGRQDDKKPSGQPVSKKSPPNESSDYDDDQFELIDVEPLDDLPKDYSLPELTPRRKKRKFKNDEGDGDSNSKNDETSSSESDSDLTFLIIIMGGLAAMLFLGTVGFFAVPAIANAMKGGGAATSSQTVAQKALQQVLPEFEKFEGTDFQFRCEVPKGWEVEARGGQGNIPPSVRIEKGSIKIAFRSSNSGAAIQDMSQAGANMSGGELPDELKPVARVHSFQREKINHEMSNYKEIGDVEKIETGMGEGRLSAFTATNSYGAKIMGYRVTLLTTQYQWNVICQCSSKRDFDANKLMFRKVIQGASQ